MLLVRLPYHFYFYLHSASREEAGSHWANYATCQEQRAGGLSSLPTAQSGYTTQNREARGNNAVALVSRAKSSHSMRTPHHLHSAGGTGANKSLTGFGERTMCSRGDVYVIHWGSEIARWKNLSVGHQACFHWAGSHSGRLAAADKLRDAGLRGVCVRVRLLRLLDGPDRGLVGGGGLRASAVSRAKGPGALHGHLPQRSGVNWSQLKGGGSGRGLTGGQWKTCDPV